MPWLVGTALIHSLAVTEKRGTFRSWTVLLAIVAFSLSLRRAPSSCARACSPRCTRSRPIRRAASSSSSSSSIVIGGSLALFAWRAPRVGLGGGFAPVSRESMLLANNVLLVVALAAVMLGTLYPLFLDALDLGKISVGPPYFDAVFFPLMAPAIFLMAIGPVASWKRARAARRCGRGCAGRSAWRVVAALVLPFVMGRWSPLRGLRPAARLLGRSRPRSRR